MVETASQLNRKEGARPWTGMGSAENDLSMVLPEELRNIENPNIELPRVAKDERLIRLIEGAIREMTTRHTLYLGDARDMRFLQPESVHLVLTSPPYWTLKDYPETTGQLGLIADYELFLKELEKVWAQCFHALVPEGRLICVVGDVCLSRRKNSGRHVVVPLHPSKNSAGRSAMTTWLQSSGAKYRMRPTKLKEGADSWESPTNPTQ